MTLLSLYIRSTWTRWCHVTLAELQDGSTVPAHLFKYTCHSCEPQHKQSGSTSCLNTEFSDHIHQCPLAKEARTKPLWRLNALAASLLGLQSYRIAMYLTRLETYVTSLER
jgi:hypothetical protein